MADDKQIVALTDLVVRARNWDARMKAHPSAVKALVAVLGALARFKIGKREPFSWATDIKALLEDAPGLCEAIVEYVPPAIFVLTEFRPVGTGIVGDRR